jgi:UDPglucose 6-dehydrogenase
MGCAPPDPEEQRVKISVVGCGYLGTVHAAALAKLGHQVVGIDVDDAKIRSLTAGVPPFYEPDLDDLLSAGISSGKLSFSSDFAAAAGATVHFIAVGTPQQRMSNSADLTFVNSALASLAPYLSDGDLVVGKSTVPVGTAARLANELATLAPGATLAWNPEFLREGFAVQDTISPDRLVYGIPSGVTGDSAKEALDEVYAVALSAGTPLVVTDYATAELVKVSANAFLATKISFINAMAEIAEVTGADVTMLADAIGFDARIGRRFLNAGLGFGGGCLPKDIRAFTARAEELGLDESVSFLREVDNINLRRRDRVVDLVLSSFGGDATGKRVAILGLAFKPDSDDIRDSPALAVALKLRAAGATVVATDPKAISNAKRLHPDMEFAETADSAMAGADAVVLATEWKEFRRIDAVGAAQVVGRPFIVDGRNCLDREVWRAAGWTYVGLGRP